MLFHLIRSIAYHYFGIHCANHATTIIYSYQNYIGLNAEWCEGFDA